MRVRALGILAAALLAVAAPVASASRSVPRPQTVIAASLTQSAQQIVWTVKLGAPFSPAEMKRAGRSLCLLIEGPRDGRVSGSLCVIPPRTGGRSPRLVYQRVEHGIAGHAKVVDAAVSQSGPSELTASFTPSVYGSSAYLPVRWQVRTGLRPPACRPVRADPVGCLSLFPAKPALAELHTPQVVGCVPSGPDYVANGSPRVHELALTFDDGPWYDTPEFLNILERYDVPATFFEIGDQIASYGQGGAVERRMLSDGDMIGDHTWNHANVSGAGSFARSEIAEAAHAINVATHGFQPCLFRAPYGAVSTALTTEARSMGFTTIDWDVDPRDWARPGTSSIYHTVISTAHNGSIILQHDGGGDRSETLAALPQEIETFKREGYRFVTVTRLLGQRLIYR